jgi:hypothetical protein
MSLEGSELCRAVHGGLQRKQGAPHERPGVAGAPGGAVAERRGSWGVSGGAKRRERSHQSTPRRPHFSCTTRRTVKPVRGICLESTSYVCRYRGESS